ncbi:trimethylamine methyltransferase family protein [Methanococcoides burtonii]|nr:trimethylamine methyltransferase family protein [Methanococcoides burtonii]
MQKGIKGYMSGRLCFLTKEDCKEIHDTSVDILGECGVKIESEYALDKLSDFGCIVNRKNSIVKFPKYVIDDCLRYAPRSIKLYGRASKYDIKIESGRTYTSTASGYGIIDRNKKIARDGILNDVAEGTLVAENLDNIHSVIPFLTGVHDVPSEIASPIILGETFKNTNKTVEFYLTGGSNISSTLKDMDNVIKLSKIVAGSTFELRKKPFLMFLISSISPLTYTEDQSRILFRTVEEGLPLVIMPAILSGMTGPVTIAGTLVQSNAEFLAGLVMANSMKKGAPVMYGHSNTILDMHTGIYSGGAVEMGLISACIAQMGEYYDIPTNSYCPKSDSHISDQQVGYEKAIQWILGSLSGVSYLSGAGCVTSESLVSLEQLVIDNEVIGMVNRVNDGINITEETLAGDLIKYIGPGGNYMKTNHTTFWLNSEHFKPKISQKDSYTQWLNNEEKDIVDVAAINVENILEIEQSPVNNDVIKDIDNFQNELLKNINNI